MTYTRISLTKQIQVYDLLKANTRKLEGHYCEYTSPHANDVVIAKMAGCSPYSVARIRRELFGNLRDSPREWNKENVTILIKRLNHLTEWAILTGYVPPPHSIAD
jgi:hypothetical protein